MQTCNRCGEDQPLDRFREHSRICKGCQYRQQREWVARNHQKDRERQNAWRREAQAKAYVEARKALGDQCAWCGITDTRVLDIDHVNGGGTADRKKRDRVQILKSIVRDPTGFQLLCCNCHRIKTLQGTRTKVAPE